MDISEYKQRVKAISSGKILPTATYLHIESIESAPKSIAKLVLACRQNLAISDEFNVLKFFHNEFKISFLRYPDFFKKPHPILREAININLATGKQRRFSYESSSNPPILHRKEVMISEEHPDQAKFRALTHAEEEHNLYENTTTIGFLLNWEKVLAEKGLRYKGHKLIQDKKKHDSAGTKKKNSIKRHRTAISRNMLSKPVQTLLEHNLLRKGVSFFDYGCGLGDDLRMLSELDIKGSGWDPAYEDSSSKAMAEIVNLGFVLNVIEDPAERTLVLREAYSLANTLLAISVITPNSQEDKKWKSYGDGVVTTRSTFQKYFSQNELRQYIEDVLDVSVVAISMGIFYAFKKPEDQLEFLAKRTKRTINWETLSRKFRPKQKKDNAQLKYIEHKELLNDFWSIMLDLGRLPTKKEYNKFCEISKHIGSCKKARDIFIQIYGESALEKAYRERMDDWLVFLALANFSKKQPFSHFSHKQQADIKSFFVTYPNAKKESERLLYKIGKPDIIERLCTTANQGYCDDQALFIHKSLLQELDPVLRIYFGCAEMVYGETQDTDIIKFHKRSGKITLLEYNKFEGKMLPELTWRTKINLRTQEIDVFDHRSKENAQLLYFKERFVSEEHPKRKTWEAYSRKLRKLGLSEDMGFGPTKAEFKELLDQNNLTPSLRTKRVQS